MDAVLVGLPDIWRVSQNRRLSNSLEASPLYEQDPGDVLTLHLQAFPCKDVTYARGASAIGIHGPDSQEAFTMHELLCKLNRTVGPSRYGAFGEWSRPFHRQDAKEAMSLFGSPQEVDAYLFGGSIRVRWYRDYPQSRNMPLPLPQPLKMIHPFPVASLGTE